MAKLRDDKLVDDREMKVYLIHDTMEVYYNPNNKCIAPYFLGLTTSANVSRETTVEKIRAGLHNQVIAVMETDEGMEITVETGAYYADAMELKFGRPARDGKTKVRKIEPQEDGTFKDELVEVEGSILELEAGAFAKNGELQLNTVVYDSENSDQIVADLYWIFPNAKPSSDFDQAYGMAENATQEISFTPQVLRDQKIYGYYVIVPRELDDDVENCDDYFGGGSEESEVESDI